MDTIPSPFNEHKVLHEIAHYLPSQSPLKDFIHHNTLHAFQHFNFHEGVKQASTLFGYKTYLSLTEYRKRYADGQITEAVLDKVITRTKGEKQLSEWKQLLLQKPFNEEQQPRVGRLRQEWKNQYGINLDKEVHPVLFRFIGSYLDQGISMWHFPVSHQGFLASVRELQRNSFMDIIHSERGKQLLFTSDTTLADLLKLLVGEADLYEQYLFDQQFAHPGWSGMAAVLEHQFSSLLDERRISLHDVIFVELLLEIDALDKKFGPIWKPLAESIDKRPEPLFAPVQDSTLQVVYKLWQEAFEWSYYEQVLAGIQQQPTAYRKVDGSISFQGLFCIDDRECSYRRHIEELDVFCKTYGTPGFFGVDFYFQPEHGKFHTKLCPAPLTPAHLIKEIDTQTKYQRDAHFTKQTHGLLAGWLISQTLGFWSAIKLLLNIFFPSNSPAAVSSFKHTDPNAKLTIGYEGQTEAGLQVGFTMAEMAARVESLLRSIGLVDEFAPLVYVVGHGASSVNNTHYAGYDCGACSGRPGSVNARVICHMANLYEVRLMLREKGIDIPDSTRFVAALHDTTRDEIQFYDEALLNDVQAALHMRHKLVFEQALHLNAKERSRRFALVDTSRSATKVHEQVKLRSVSLFEPRPELNHATNALCIVGRRALTDHLFLDRRSFLNSYDFSVDPDGTYLFNILKAAAPVCGGINLEYYFSRTDNYRLGAGSKLPHNVMGLIGVANGMDGDLRTGLPWQMVEVHDPVRLLVIVEHFPEVVLRTIQKQDATYEWFLNEWVHLVVVEPGTNKLYRFTKGAFEPYEPLQLTLPSTRDITSVLESTMENLPVYVLN